MLPFSSSFMRLPDQAILYNEKTLVSLDVAEKSCDVCCLVLHAFMVGLCHMNAVSKK